MMDNLHLNTKLITSLSKILFMPNSMLMKAASISSTTWYVVMKTPDTITIQQLLAISNGLHIPVRLFFYIGDNNELGNRDDYVIGNYQPCHYDGDVLKSVVNNRPDATWQKAAKATGMSYQNLQRSLLAETRLPVTRLLTVCKAFELDPFEVIIDPNPPHADQRKKEKTISALRGYKTILENIATMQHEMAYFKVLLEETKRDIAELGKKLDVVAVDTEVQPIAWRTRRIASEAAKMAKEAQEQNKKLIVNGK